MSVAISDARRPVPSRAEVANESGPFVGTRPYAGGEAHYFFGRETEAAELASIVAASNLAVVYGASGVGKSSLLNAGLPDALKEFDTEWLIIRYYAWQPGYERKLEKKVSRKIGTPVVMSSLAKSLLTFAVANDRPVLLILDQFEEYFLYCGKGSSLDAELAKLVNRRAGPVRVLLGLRNDGLFLLDRLRTRIPDVFKNMLLVEPLEIEAAKDCVIKPIEAYNSARDAGKVEVPARDSPLVKALVEGAEERLINKKLSGGGRGEVKEEVDGPRRIDALFLQMTLDELWREDIERGRGGKRLQLATLRWLADLKPLANEDEDATSSSDAVGLIARKFVNKILRSFTGKEKEVCASMLERMVLPSGGKVAVKEIDLTAGLDVSGQGLVKGILEKLSDERERLIKRVAHESSESEPHFQIMHDALAMPILDWTKEFKEEEKIAKESQRLGKRIVASAIVLFVALGSIAIWVFTSYSNSVSQPASVAESDPRSHFRLPLLFSLTSLIESRRLGIVPLLEGRPREVIEKILLRSPRDGGQYRAAAFDQHSAKVAWLRSASRANANEVIVCSLRETDSCGAGNDRQRPPIPLPPGPMPASKSPALQRQDCSMGFVRNFADPILVCKGMLYYHTGRGWSEPFDIANVADDIDQRGAFVQVTITENGVRLLSYQPPSGASFIDLPIQDGSPPLPSSVEWKVYAQSSPSRGAFPIVSPNGASTAAVTLEKTATAPGQGSDTVDGGATRARVLLTLTPVGEGSPAIKADLGYQALEASGEPPPVSGTWLGFAQSEQFVTVLHAPEQVTAIERTKISLFNLSSHNEQPQMTFTFDDSVNFGRIQQRFGLPPISAFQEDEKRWWFAWPSPSGVELAEGAPSAPLSRPPDYPRPLLSGLDNATDVRFSDDGRFLYLQSWQPWLRANSFRVWDLSDHWREEVDAAAGGNFDSLRDLACRVAAIEDPQNQAAGGDEFTRRMKEWGLNVQPCPGPS